MDGIAVQWNFTEEEDRTVLIHWKGCCPDSSYLILCVFKGTLSSWDVFIQ